MRATQAPASPPAAPNKLQQVPLCTELAFHEIENSSVLKCYESTDRLRSFNRLKTEKYDCEMGERDVKSYQTR
jgi:antirestriction protein